MTSKGLPLFLHNNIRACMHVAAQRPMFLRHFELLICSWCTEARLGNFAYRPVRASGSTQGLVVSSMPERKSAPGALCAEAGQRAAAPFPAPLSSACGIFPPLCSGQISLDEAEHLLHNRVASVATLRWCSGSSRNSVRIPSEICVQPRRNPQAKPALPPGGPPATPTSTPCCHWLL